MREVSFTHRWVTFVSYYVAVMVQLGCATATEPQQAQKIGLGQDRQRIQLDRSVRFATPDGKHVVVESGAYKVEQSTGSQIRLVQAGDAQPTLLSAEAVSLDHNVSIPTAVLMPLEPDEYDLILQLPDGAVLTAHGSVSEVQSRGIVKGAYLMPGMVKGPDLAGCVICQPVWGACLFKTSIKNQGDVAAPQSVAELSESRIDPSRPDIKFFYKTSFKQWPLIWIVPALGPGEIKQFNIVVSLSADQMKGYDSSQYTPRLRVDLRNQVIESNENNNMSSENGTTGVTCP